MPAVLAAALVSFVLGGACGFLAYALCVAGADHPTPPSGSSEPPDWVPFRRADFDPPLTDREWADMERA